jgi:hypothetical protein
LTPMKTYVFIVLIFLHACYSFEMEGATKRLLVDNNISDSLYAKNDYLLPTFETFGLNVFVWASLRYVVQADYARIGTRTISNNLKTGFVWDTDDFWTNQFSHPYHGGLYFTLSRSSGLNFWNSLYYPFGGSLMWELFMENEPPSINDFIVTPTSGIILGEITYRISLLIINDGKSGWARTWREIAAAAICPMHGFNRHVLGKKQNLHAPPSEHPFSAMLSLGANGIFFDRKLSKNGPHMFIGYSMEYGELYGAGVNNNPFDYFITSSNVILSRNNLIVEIFGSGMLWGINSNFLGSEDGIIGMFADFDYLHNAVYKLSATSVGGKIVNYHILSPSFELSTSTSVTGIILGGTNSLYAEEELGRNYNLGPGLNTEIETAVTVASFGSAYLKWQYYWLHTISGTDGNDLLMFITVGTSINIVSNISFNLEYLQYNRWVHYTDYPTKGRSNFAIRSYIGITL